MKRPLIALAGAVWILIVMVVGWEVVRAVDPALDTAKIEQLTGGKGEINAQEGVFKVTGHGAESRPRHPASLTHTRRGETDMAEQEPQTAQHTSIPVPPLSLGQLVLYFLKLGTIGFGGPAALVGYMRKDLVDEGQRIEQTAIAIGYFQGGVLGATLVGLAFIVPSFLMVLVLSWLYMTFGGLPWMQALFYGIGAVVIAIIAIAAYRLARGTKMVWPWGNSPQGRPSSWPPSWAIPSAPSGGRWWPSRPSTYPPLH